jgi:hypothetical protein
MFNAILRAVTDCAERDISRDWAWRFSAGADPGRLVEGGKPYVSVTSVRLNGPSSDAASHSERRLPPRNVIRDTEIMECVSAVVN